MIERTIVAPAPSFASLFGRRADVAVEAPGRVNLIGEHTDYNGGYVLPTVIPQTTRVELAKRVGRTVRTFSADVGDAHATLTFALGSERRRNDWLDYVQGCTQAVLATGAKLHGFDLRITSEVPLGSGLSSSAALEIAVLRAIREAFDLSLDDKTLALLGHKAETDFVGAPVGVMDQMASSLARAGEALFLDTRSLEYQRIPIPAEVELAVISSGITHSHAGGEYRVRRRECEEAAERLGVSILRDLTEAQARKAERLPPPLDRRVRHVLTENDRVLKFVGALRAGDPAELGRLLTEAHDSLRDDFEVSVPEIDRIVALSREEDGVLGARLTGGGFGGSVVLLAQTGAARQAGENVAKAYAEETGNEATLLVPPPTMTITGDRERERPAPPPERGS